MSPKSLSALGSYLAPSTKVARLIGSTVTLSSLCRRSTFLQAATGRRTPNKTVFESRAGARATRAIDFHSKQRSRSPRMQPAVRFAHNRTGHRSTLRAPLCAVHLDASSLPVPTGVRQAVRLLPVECFRGASAAMGGSLASPAKSLKLWRASVDEDGHYAFAVAP